MTQDYQDAALRESRIRQRVHRLAEFYQHLMAYVIFNTLLWSMASVMYLNDVSSFKFVFVVGLFSTMGWGIGLLSHAITVLPVWRIFGKEWEDEKVKALMSRERN